MPFPPVPALVLPAYLFFMITPMFILLGIILSLMIFTDTKKWLVAISITLPVLVIVVISPVLEIMKLTLVCYLIGFVGGSLFFYTTLVEKRHKPKYYYGPPQIITGPLAQLGHMFQVTFENATFQPTQRVEENFTEIDFGSGILRIFHSPLKFEFLPKTGENLKLKIIDLITTSNTIIYCGNLTEKDGPPKGFEVSYQEIESYPIISVDSSETIVYFHLRGYTRVFGINQDRTVDIAEDLKDHISVNDLTKA